MCTLTTLVLHLEDKSSTGNTRVFDVAAGRKQTEERNRWRRRLRLPGRRGRNAAQRHWKGIGLVQVEKPGRCPFPAVTWWCEDPLRVAVAYVWQMGPISVCCLLSAAGGPGGAWQRFVLVETSAPWGDFTVRAHTDCPDRAWLMGLAGKPKRIASLGSGTAVCVGLPESSEHLCPPECQGGSSSNLTSWAKYEAMHRWLVYT